jgi:hypothetical protein
VLDGIVAAVEPQAGLPGGAVGPVAGEAVLHQDRPHVLIERQRARRRLDGTRRRDGEQAGGRERGDKSGAAHEISGLLTGRSVWATRLQR